MRQPRGPRTKDLLSDIREYAGDEIAADFVEESVEEAQLTAEDYKAAWLAAQNIGQKQTALAFERLAEIKRKDEQIARKIRIRNNVIEAQEAWIKEARSVLGRLWSGLDYNEQNLITELLDKK